MQPQAFKKDSSYRSGNRNRWTSNGFIDRAIDIVEQNIGFIIKRAPGNRATGHGFGDCVCNTRLDELWETLTAKLFREQRKNHEQSKKSRVWISYIVFSIHFHIYAQTLILVNLVVVKNRGFLVITRNHMGISGPHQDTSFLSCTRTSLYLPGAQIQTFNLSFWIRIFYIKPGKLHEY